MRKRDKRRRRRKKAVAVKQPEHDLTGRSIQVKRDSRGRQYIKAPDGSVRRRDKTASAKLFWLSE